MKAPKHSKCEAGNRDADALLRLANVARIAFPNGSMLASGFWRESARGVFLSSARPS